MLLKDKSYRNNSSLKNSKINNELTVLENKEKLTSTSIMKNSGILR
jgi:hypothetical protein